MSRIEDEDPKIGLASGQGIKDDGLPMGQGQWKRRKVWFWHQQSDRILIDTQEKQIQLPEVLWFYQLRN